MKSSLPQTTHRARPSDERSWIMTQNWHDLLFAHWPVPAATLRPLIPPALSLDTFDGQAWLGIIPFHMSGVRLRGMPPVPWLSRFPEVNVRTYVTDGERPGVWFFSLDATRRLAVAAARRWYHLPYYRAKISVRQTARGIVYSSHRADRNSPDAAFTASYGPTGCAYRADYGGIEHWLTERYCLYTIDRRGHLYRGEIHHAPWSLQPARADITVNTMTGAMGLLLSRTPPLLQFARSLHVTIWAIQRADAN